MPTALPRLLLAVASALLVAGVVGLATHHSGATRAVDAPATASTTPTGSTATTGPAAGSPGPGTAPLNAGLVTPTDMGGYYRVVPAAAASLLDSAPCLAALQPSPTQGGRALTALLGPNRHSVPYLVEDVASYPGARSSAVYRSLVTSIDACPSLTFGFDGAAIAVRIAASSIPLVGDADQVWTGSFTAAGVSFTFQLGAVLDGPAVLAVIWIDSVPPSPAIEGNFTSTVSLAIGKLA
jgi:hypothetical protein